MARLFGTDGVRGIANTELTCELAYHLGQAAVAFLGGSIVVGRDTRLSGEMLQSALIAGIASAGGTSLVAGVIPTPGVAYLVRELSAAGGVVISASHNPPEYNGIKFFDSDGFKLSDEAEDEVEDFVVSGGLESAVLRAHEAGDDDASMPVGTDLGCSLLVEQARALYVDHAVQSIFNQGIDFKGMTIALDAAHGASSMTSAEALRRLGADVIVINDDYDGSDINVLCGSTHLEPLREFMASSGADVGIAHDGDADRVMVVTPSGDAIDGDVIEAVCALDMRERGVLAKNTVVTTIMCNLGFIHAMNDAGIDVVQTKVGDRHVLEAMREGGFSIGGEQSGHIILLDHNSTGDGLMTAVQFLAAVVRSGKPVGEVAGVVTRFPQSLMNVQVVDKDAAVESPKVVDAVRAAREALGDDGRVILRPSGTEPVVRIMVEAREEDVARLHAERIAEAVKAEQG